MKKAVFIIFLFCIFLPSKSLAFDIYGWWQSQETPSVLFRITENKFFGLDYKINSKTNSKVELFIDHSNVPSYVEKKDTDIITITKAIGDKEDYKLVTRDTNLKREDVRKLCGID
ncbi:hypothetical protein [uncultured Desulfovibrio sp.]|uniref:hypothetical protein n=1 Tax=uncultured Desulfovibrio sp. TaxID=167968 RepID=UPI0026249E90|nr:hypothetical protein [uncultured Desulfovibrio sp.]